jgi:DNA-binding beta-propeller fold protein YncE
MKNICHRIGIPNHRDYILTLYAIQQQPGILFFFRRSGNRIWLGSSKAAVASISLSGFTSAIYSHSDFLRPQQVAACDGRSGVWIADVGSNKAHYLTISGLQWSRGGFTEVNDILVDDTGSVCWVADAPADRIVAIDADSGQELASITGLGNPFYLAYNKLEQLLYVSGSNGQITVLNLDHQKIRVINFSERTGKIALMY